MSVTIPDGNIPKAVPGGSYTESDFIALSPTTFNPFYDRSAPRAVVALNGSRYVPVKYSITFNAHGATDEASIELPISSNPDFTAALANSDDTSSEPIYAEIYAGFPSSPAVGSTDISQLSQRFLGVVDRYEARFSDDSVTFPCRSLAAPLVDNKVTFSPINMTGAQFGAAIAAMLGLTFNLGLRSRQQSFTIAEVLGKELVGGTNLTAGIFNKTYWQILLQCALFDDVDVWVSNATLNYVAPDVITRKTIAATYGHNISMPVGDHSVQFNKNIRVEVRTYQTRTKTSTTWRVDSNLGSAGGVTQTSSSKITSSSPLFGTNQNVSTTTNAAGITSTTVSSSSGGSFKGLNQPASESGLERYIYYLPNLTPAKCNALALSYWRQLSMKQYSIDFSMAVTEKLLAQVDITSLFQVSGLPYTAFNDKYWPRRIDETFDPSEGGWSWAIHAANTQAPMGGV